MGSIAGLAVVLVMVFGGYLAAGGKIGILLKALPFEMMMIGGAATGAFIIANSLPVVKSTLRDLSMVLRGPRWKPQDYQDVLCLLFALIKIGRRDQIALETHIEAPEDSPLFQAYPRVLADRHAVSIVCDTLRVGMMNYDDPHQVEDVLDRQLDARLHHALGGANALQTMADGLPALGIVAAVLGVIKTMASIDQPPEILGGMIGGALVGTFLGVFLSYCLVGPLSQRIRMLAEEDHRFYESIRDALVASLHQHSPQLCVEVARQNLHGHARPSFDELDQALKAAQEAA